MTKIYDELVDFERGADTGQNTRDSIQPIKQEQAWPGAASRPDENLRVRTEVLKLLLETSNYFIDADRGLVLRSGAPFTFTQPEDGRYVLSIAPGGQLWVSSALSPGQSSGGRDGGGKVFCENPSEGGAWTPYAGTLGTDELTLTASRATTGQRGYADCDDFAQSPSGLSIGANRIRFSLSADPTLAGGTANVRAVISGSPRSRIHVTYGTLGTPTTLGQLIAFINNDRTSQGSFGVADFLYASTTGALTNPPVPFTGGRVQGAYDAEMHAVTDEQFSAFFEATVSGEYVNRLREGEGLAIGYPLGPVQRGVPAPRGGRRQALWDLPTSRSGVSTPNVTPTNGWSLFVTGREPEKIPGAVPIGKVIDGEFVFIDGTRLGVGETLTLGESRSMWAALALLGGGGTTSGAARIGYEGGESWNADAASTLHAAMLSGTVRDAIDQIVDDLANEVDTQSGSRRVGSENLTGTPSVGNEVRQLSLPAGSIREQLLYLLNGSTTGVLLGINGRVSEAGHRLVGAAPLRKEFGFSGMPAAGAVMLQAELHAPTNLMASVASGVQEFASLNLQPIVYANAVDADDFLTASNFVTFSAATALLLTGMSSAQFTKVFAKLPIAQEAFGGNVLPLLFVKLTGLAECADAADGIYTIFSRDTSTRTVVLRRLDGSSPDFTGLTGTPTMTFMSSLAVGNDVRGTRLHGFVHTDLTQNTLGAPVAALGLSTEESRLLALWLPNGNAGTIFFTQYAGRAEYRSPRRTVGGYVTRSTVNLLTTSDKQLLDGQETGAPVDASASHHHGALYASWTRRSPNNISNSVSSLSDTAPGTSFPTTAPSGSTNVAALIYYVFTIKPAAAGDVTVAFLFIEPTNRTVHFINVQFTAASTSDERIFRGQVTTPLTTNNYYVQKSPALFLINVDQAQSSYSFDVLAIQSVKN